MPGINVPAAPAAQGAAQAARVPTEGAGHPARVTAHYAPNEIRWQPPEASQIPWNAISYDFGRCRDQRVMVSGVLDPPDQPDWLVPSEFYMEDFNSDRVGWLLHSLCQDYRT